MYQIRKFSVVYRLPIGILFLILAIWVTIKVNVWAALIIYIISILTLLAHFLIGPVSIIQKSLEGGDFEEAKKLINAVRFPNLLYKPIRSMYFMLQSQFATMNNDFDAAELNIKKSIQAGTMDASVGGAAYLQLGMIALRKNNMKEAFENLKIAVKEGLPDKETEATAYLQLCSICMQRRDYKASKNYFRKAKSLNPQTPEVKNQVKEIEKYISRIPG